MVKKARSIGHGLDEALRRTQKSAEWLKGDVEARPGGAVKAKLEARAQCAQLAYDDCIAKFKNALESAGQATEPDSA
jgi:NifU-like protein involved in Fe-S cluster formation